MDDLPYNGNLQDAIRAGDRDAIRVIMNYRAQQPSPPIEEETLLPERAQNCLNTEDYISNERWSDEYEPTVTIRYMNFDESIGSTFCYRREDLIKLSNTLEHAWIIPYNDEGLYFDDDGKVRSPRSNVVGYGEPSVVEKFVKVPPAYYIWYKNFIEAISNSDHLIAIPLYKTRLGTPNIDAYRPSTSHGQAPDTTVYYLVDENAFNFDRDQIYRDIYDVIYEAKTFRSPDGLWAINELQNTYRQSLQDNQYYWIDLPKLNGYNPYLEPLPQPPQSQTQEQQPQEQQPQDLLTEVNIVATMIDMIIDPPEGRRAKNEFLGRLYNIYRDDYVIDTNHLIPKTDPMGEYRWDPLEIALSHLNECINLYSNYELFHDEFDNFYADMIIGGMFNMFNEIFESDDLTLYINTKTYVEVGVSVDHFGAYIIPPGANPIYDVVLFEMFVNANPNNYTAIDKWEDFTTFGISVIDVINKILGTPMLSNDIFLRMYMYYHHKDLTVNDIYTMFEIIFQAGYMVTDNLNIVPLSSQGNSFRSTRDIIYASESRLLLALFNRPELLKLVEDNIETNRFNITMFIRHRLEIIGETESIIFNSGNIYQFGGTVPLSDNYLPNYYNRYNAYHIDGDQLDLMYYLDTNFAELIGAYPLTQDDLDYLKHKIEMTY